MSIPQESAEVAKSAIEGLRQQPLCLALVIVNLALLGWMYYNERNSYLSRTTLFERIMDGQKTTQELLSHCIVPR